MGDTPAPPAPPYGILFTEPAKVQAVLDATGNGCEATTAARAAGISPRLLQHWRKEGRAAVDAAEQAGIDPADIADPREHAYAEFFIRFTIARARIVAQVTGQVLEFARGGQLIEEITETRRDGTEITRRRFQPPDWRGLVRWLETVDKQYWARGNEGVLTADRAPAADLSTADGRLSAAMAAYAATGRTSQSQN